MRLLALASPPKDPEKILEKLVCLASLLRPLVKETCVDPVKSHVELDCLHFFYVLLLIDPSYVSSKWILDQPIWCSGEIWPGRWDRSRLVAPSVPLASLIAQEMARLRFPQKNQLSCSIPTQLQARAHPLLHSSRFPEGFEGCKKRRQIDTKWYK